MNEKSIIWVAYDKSETDLSCVVCTEPNNGRAKMRVGYMGDDADELYKIVSEQGYLAEHDKEVRNKTIEEIRSIFCEDIFDRYSWCDGTMNFNNCSLMMCEIIEKLKEGEET